MAEEIKSRDPRAARVLSWVRQVPCRLAKAETP
jgi:hypothetical protein